MIRWRVKDSIHQRGENLVVSAFFKRESTAQKHMYSYCPLSPTSAKLSDLSTVYVDYIVLFANYHYSWGIIEYPTTTTDAVVKQARRMYFSSVTLQQQRQSRQRQRRHRPWWLQRQWRRLDNSADSNFSDCSLDGSRFGGAVAPSVLIVMLAVAVVENLSAVKTTLVTYAKATVIQQTVGVGHVEMILTMTASWINEFLKGIVFVEPIPSYIYVLQRRFSNVSDHTSFLGLTSNRRLDWKKL